MVFLGWKLWTAPVQVEGDLAANTVGASHRGMFWHAFAVTALNPKSILFFVAFVPQFIDKQSAYGPQVAILVATFVVLAVFNSLAYALVGARARTMLRRPSVLKAVNRTGGGILMGAGVAAALTRAS